ncbi:MAG: transporter permease, partial [Frankiales bacterium]|nr:transporter permease [Frankiales bacterium]
MSVDQSPALAPALEPEPGHTPRSSAWRSLSRHQDTVAVNLLSVLMALVVGALLIAIANDQVRTDLGYFFSSPQSFFADAWTAIRQAYAALFAGSIYDSHQHATLTQALTPLATTVYTATPLICVGLGISLAFRVGLFNIGGEGQVTV